MIKVYKILILVLVLTAVLGFGLSAQILFHKTWVNIGTAQINLDLRVGEPTLITDVPDFAADQLIVKFKPGQSPIAVEELKAAHGAEEIRASKNGGGFVTLRLVEGSDVLAKAEVFSRNPLVEYAHPNFFAQAHFVPNDTFYNFQWHFDDDNTNNPGGASTNPFGGANGGGIRMEEAWDITTGTTSVIVAVLDSGVAYEDFSDSNPAQCYNMMGQLKKCPGKAIDEYFQASDLASTSFLILTGSDFVNGDDHPNDDESHGTHVTGTIAQSTNNNHGVAGIAFNTTIMPVKVLDGNGSGLFDVIADAIRFATDNGADVINMSLGSEFDAQAMEDAVAYAFANGVLVVTSAGNDFQTGNDIQFPAAYDASVMAVGATRYDEARAPYSSTGSYVDIAAPGGDTSVNQNDDIGCGPGGTSGCPDGVLQQTFGTNDPSDFAFFFFQGTSMAAPHVSGLAALILAVDSSLTPTQVRNVIESTAEDKGTTGRDDEFGFGIIDAQAALASIVSAVSISLTTDGAVGFGILPLNSTQDTTVSGINDVQTVIINVGPVNLDVKSTLFFDNGNTWSFGATNGADQVKWEFSPDGTTWTTFLAADTLSNLANNVAQGASQSLYLRITMPTGTASSNLFGSTVTIMATTP